MTTTCRRPSARLLFAALIALSACSREASDSALQVAPGEVEVAPGDVVHFAAELGGSKNQKVDWAVADAGGGTIDANGSYTAPATEGAYTVTASLGGTLTTRQESRVWVRRGVRVSVTPLNASLTTGQTVSLVANVSGTSNKAVTWSVAESDGGSVAADGTYTAPATAGVYHVFATSVVDPSRSGTSTVTVTDAPVPTTPVPAPVPPPVVLAVSPQTASVVEANTVQLTATVSGTSNTAVTWAVQESGGGTVSSAGLYSAPLVVGTFHVVATSVADPSQTATAAISVTPTPPAPAVSVAISPATTSISAGGSVQFTATVSGTTSTGVNWTVQEGAAGGSVSSTGRYTAPSTAGTYHVVATSQADASKTSSATVTVTAPTPTPTPTPAPPPGIVPAFPGAQGGGAGTKGGRGGTVIKVTNLNDSGAGSLRACATASGPRTCVFTVGGVINLLSTIHIYNPYLTIAGQTAPGGVAVYTGRGAPVSNREVYALSVEASDVVIRYLRIWGDTVPNQSAPAALGSIAVAIYAPRVIVDHVTALWQTGYTMAADVGGPKNGADLTLQWNLMGENVLNTTNYPNGQSTPLLLLSDGSHTGDMWDPYGVTDVDLHHNLIANADHRLPGTCAQTGRIINNALYNWGRMEYVDTGEGSLISVDFIGNHYKAGPWNGGNGPGGAGYREIQANRGSVASGGTPTFSLFVSANKSDWAGWDSTKGDRGTVSPSDSDATQWSKLTGGSTSYQGAMAPGYIPLPSTYRRSARLGPPASGLDVTVDSAANLASILTAPGGVGASRYLSCSGTWVNFRDSAETRILGNYVNGTGPSGPPSSAAGANGGALPTITPGAPCADTDGDGIPDAYESAHGLNPNDASDAARVASDGYTNLEHYLNGQ